MYFKVHYFNKNDFDIVKLIHRDNKDYIVTCELIASTTKNKSNTQLKMFFSGYVWLSKAKPVLLKDMPLYAGLPVKTSLYSEIIKA